MQNLLKEIEPLEARMKILSYGIVLLKRFYLRYTILEKPDLHQHVLTCTYLAMKLDEVKYKNFKIDSSSLNTVVR